MNTLILVPYGIFMMWDKNGTKGAGAIFLGQIQYLGQLHSLIKWNKIRN